MICTRGIAASSSPSWKPLRLLSAAVAICTPSRKTSPSAIGGVPSATALWACRCGDGGRWADGQFSAHDCTGAPAVGCQGEEPAGARPGRTNAEPPPQQPTNRNQKTPRPGRGEGGGPARREGEETRKSDAAQAARTPRRREPGKEQTGATTAPSDEGASPREGPRGSPGKICEGRVAVILSAFVQLGLTAQPSPPQAVYLS